MAKKSKSRRAKATNLVAKTSEHGAQIKRHARAIDALEQSNRLITAALKLRGIALPKIPSRDQVRAGIADAMSTPADTVHPGDIHDDDKLVIKGGVGALVQFLGKLNGEFWSDGHWHITPNDVKGITIGKLIDLILKRLAGS